MVDRRPSSVIEIKARELIDRAEWMTPTGPVLVGFDEFVGLVKALADADQVRMQQPNPDGLVCSGCGRRLVKEDGKTRNGMRRFCLVCRTDGTTSQIRQQEYRKRKRDGTTT